MLVGEARAGEMRGDVVAGYLISGERDQSSVCDGRAIIDSAAAACGYCARGNGDRLSTDLVINQSTGGVVICVTRKAPVVFLVIADVLMRRAGQIKQVAQVFGSGALKPDCCSCGRVRHAIVSHVIW